MDANLLAPIADCLWSNTSMFVQVKKNSQVFVQNRDMNQHHVAPVTSNFRINLNLVAEASFYSIKEVKQRKLLDGRDFEIPVGTKVIHLIMSYTHSVHTEAKGAPQEHTVNDRYFYKLVFLPEAEDEYLRIRNIFDRQTLS
jgi:hypothetical protein